MSLTPVNLIISVFVVLFFHDDWDIRFVVFLFVVFSCGYLIEAIGVNTGKVFGQYFYGNNLGVKLFDTPLIIGVNWLMLSYCSSVVARQALYYVPVIANRVVAPLLATCIMVILDVIIEQVAPQVDFWYWKNQVVPLQNYTAWFAFAFAFNFLFQQMETNSNNPIAKWLLGLQFVFFLGLYFLLPF